MNEDPDKSKRLDFSAGVSITEFAEGDRLLGHVGEEEVLVVRADGKLFAIGAHCTHYHAPLVDGLIVGKEIRCPWHHARFDVSSGEAKTAPAFDTLGCWTVEQRGEQIFVTGKRTSAKVSKGPVFDNLPQSIVIIGGGAAGFAAAARLRRENYTGSLTILSAESSVPVDRPNLSKDYLAGTAKEDWLPLRSPSFYQEACIDLRTGVSATALDRQSREVILSDGSKLSYDRLLLATGAEPLKLSLPGSDLPHVFTLRSLDDCRSIIEQARGARRALVMGASFIGLEVAASLRTRGLEVHVVAPDKRPMERVFGTQMGDFVRALHESKGVVFHLEDVATLIEKDRVTLKSGGVIEADLVIVGVGVRPRVELAERAGLVTDRGVIVNAYLETSAPDIFAAGDIARWPDPHSGENIRVEHWVVAERQGQTAAVNMLGGREKFDAVPFFWSQHYDIPINYVGHAEKWDDIAIDGDIAGKDCLLRFTKGERTLAVASIFRDIDSLRAELAMEQAAVT
jgi:NADPH-dependent 2,4-dienoyl-CoA reductase/sulfur reductase-like enzyme/nitrite reductase/ring-hydroxylating ferredoxin subunit